MIDEMVQEVARAAGLAPESATLAVTSMLRLMAARLPSPLFGELQAQLQLPPQAGAHDTPADRVDRADRGQGAP